MQTNLLITLPVYLLSAHMRCCCCSCLFLPQLGNGVGLVNPVELTLSAELFAHIAMIQRRECKHSYILHTYCCSLVCLCVCVSVCVSTAHLSIIVLSDFLGSHGSLVLGQLTLLLLLFNIISPKLLLLISLKQTISPGEKRITKEFVWMKPRRRCIGGQNRLCADIRVA